MAQVIEALAEKSIEAHGCRFDSRVAPPFIYFFLRHFVFPSSLFFFLFFFYQNDYLLKLALSTLLQLTVKVFVEIYRRSFGVHLHRCVVDVVEK